MQYKVEHDWKMCYLARTQGSHKAFIEWLFCFDEKKIIDKIEIKFSTASYENGKIELSLQVDQNENEKLNLDKNVSTKNSSFKCSYKDEYFVLSRNENTNLSSIKLRADLSEGKGDCSWQHTQLFRTSLNDKDLSSFHIIFYFK